MRVGPDWFSRRQGLSAVVWGIPVLPDLKVLTFSSGGFISARLSEVWHSEPKRVHVPLGFHMKHSANTLGLRRKPMKAAALWPDSELQ